MRNKELPPEVRDFFVKMGRQGGLVGGRARAAKLTAEERRESARKAVVARWNKNKKVGTLPSVSSVEREDL